MGVRMKKRYGWAETGIFSVGNKTNFIFFSLGPGVKQSWNDGEMGGVERHCLSCQDTNKIELRYYCILKNLKRIKGLVPQDKGRVLRLQLYIV